MRQSITTRRAPDWMDVERQRDAKWHPDKLRVEPEPHARLAALRCDNLRDVVAQVRGKGRVPRVCRYALSVGGYWPTSSLEASAAFAVHNAWEVGGEDRIFTDPYGSPNPELRTGWSLVRKQIRSGYADGVVVTTASLISPHPEEYEQELRWFELHRAFVAVVAPTADAGRL
ncbi:MULTISPECIES: hypothetical protein [unclassified Streptomyces]|uniref:hypothetical protein n=1 Tax=unclassified Streptomyces TaxID=2593676 RepID=UPI001BEADC84|nr:MULTISPECIES: hypothetical protein [unclassified Streptomyces]MBT2405585.1 hypothetical protein [Streptomyces sp. ISL-21]MBT2607735.1 hypothetical protein [Streptomyces sp. ISL-87]